MRYFLNLLLKIFLILSLGCGLLYISLIAYLLHYEKDLIFVGQDNRAIQSIVDPNFKSEIINTHYGKTEIYTNDIDSKNVTEVQMLINRFSAIGKVNSMISEFAPA